MILITEPPRQPHPAELAGKTRDTLCLTWEERRWTRKRVTTTRGQEVALALPTGSLLRPGDVIAVEGDWYLAVEGRPEPVLAGFPRSADEAVRVAFDVGNRHFPLALEADALLVPDDTAMEQLLTRLSVKWERRQAIFDPIGQHHASGGHGHRHDPEHTPGLHLVAEVAATIPSPPGGDGGVREDGRLRGLLSLFHFSDSAFPAGGYTHSFGLESYCASGLVSDRTGLEAFLLSQLEGSVGTCDATGAVAALHAIVRDDLAACADLDATLEAMKPVREFREASRQMGRQTLRVAAALTGDARLAAYLVDVEAGRRPGHHAVSFGMAAGALGWDGEETAAAFLYSTSALLVGAALRLLRMGQMEGQRVLWGLGPVIDRLAREAAAREPADLWSFAPGIEIQGIRHAGLSTRLFRS